MQAQNPLPPRFSFYQGSTLIGWSALEHADPPMGVAFGQFFPAPAYAAIQERVRSMAGAADQSALELRARHLDAHLPAIAVVIQDYSAECDEEAIEVSVLGIGFPLYEQLFPNAVAAYLLAPE